MVAFPLSVLISETTHVLVVKFPIGNAIELFGSTCV